MSPVDSALAILLLPLAAFIIQITIGWRLPRQGDFLPTTAMGVCWLLAAQLFFGGVLGSPAGLATATRSFEWFKVGRWTFELGIAVDNGTAIMLFVVTTVSFLVHLYSTAYMRDHHGHPEPRYNRFFAYLALFTFSMLIIVVTDNLFMLFIGWELVGLCSYFLIGFYFQKPSAANASMKAFITNKVGDFGFFIGLAIVLSQVGSLDFASLFESVKLGFEGPGAVWTPGLLTAAALCLFCGAVGKSAQFPLHVWLPDAMEGPTPVSALIHAATMVAAGVYMVARLFPVFAGPGFFHGDFFSSPALWVVAAAGAITALLGATIAIVQSDIKKALAYSTVSQLGYMVIGLGVGSATAGLYHLFTHAWFKACLFLGAGSVHHAVHTYEMAQMGGLRKKMPITFITYFVSTFAIAGMPFLSGFWSKEMIVGNALAFGLFHGSMLAFVPFAIAISVAGMTSFYMFRTVWLTFFGAPRDEHIHDHAHEMPWPMTVPLGILMVLAVLGGGLTESNSHWFEKRVNADVIVNQYMAVKAGTTWKPVEVGAKGEHGAPAAGHGEATHAAAPAGHGAAAAAHGAAGGHGGSVAERFEHELHVAHMPVLVMSICMFLGGFFGSWLLFAGPWKDVDLVGSAGALFRTRTVLKNLYYIDWFYTTFVVGGVLVVRAFLGAFDKHVIDRIVNVAGAAGVLLAKLSGLADYWGVDAAVRGTASVTMLGGEEARRVQTGRLQEYVYLTVVLTAFIFVVWIVAGTLI